MLEAIGNFIITVIDQFGYLGVFILMSLESACIPIPSEVTMPFAGSLITTGRFDLWGLGLVGGMANLTGSLVAYFAGLWGQEAVIRKVIKSYGKYLLITEDEFDRSEKWFRKKGEIIVFVTRLMPIVRTFISLPAGIAKMNLYRFVIYTFLGSFIWSIFLTYIGFSLGKNWKIIEDYFHKLDLVLVLVFIAGGFFYIWHKVKKIKKQG